MWNSLNPITEPVSAPHHEYPLRFCRITHSKGFIENPVSFAIAMSIELPSHETAGIRRST